MIIRQLQGEIGAEVVGLDLARPLSDAVFAEIEAAWTRHSILVFRDLRMTPQQHIAFTRRFGPLHIMEPLRYNLRLMVERTVRTSPSDRSARPWWVRADGKSTGGDPAGAASRAWCMPYLMRNESRVGGWFDCAPATRNPVIRHRRWFVEAWDERSTMQRTHLLLKRPAA